MTEALLEKLRSLPAERVAEVEDFIDFIWSRHSDRALVTSATAASAAAFAAVWSSEADDVYDAI